MADIYDDELDLTDEEKQRRLQQQPQSVGKMIGPPVAGGAATKAIGQPIMPSKPAPMQAQSAPDISQQMPSVGSSIGTPIQPTAQGSSTAMNANQNLTDLEAKGRPQYHGLKRIGDTILASTGLGRDIEAAGNFGTQGYLTDVGQARTRVADVNKEIEEGQKQQKSGADIQQEETGDELVPVTLPDGSTAQVMRKNVATPTSAIINSASRENIAATNQAGANQRTDETVQGRKDVAGMQQTGLNDRAGDANASREKIASQRVASAAAIARGHDLTSTENARIRAAASDDPNKLTAVMKTMKQQAQATLPEIDNALNETEAVAKMLGPAAGRWNDFWQGKVGATDPKFAHYKDEIGMVSTAVTLAHARGRMSNELFEHFEQMFDAGKQSPENLIAALNVAHEWLSSYAKMGEAPVVGQGVQGGGAGTGAPAAPAAHGLKITRDPNGRIVGVE